MTKPLAGPLDALIDLLADAIVQRLAERSTLAPSAPPSSASGTPEWLTLVEAAAYLRVKPKTLEDWRAQGKGPKAHKLGTRALRFARADLDDFLRRGSK